MSQIREYALLLTDPSDPSQTIATAPTGAKWISKGIPPIPAAERCPFPSVKSRRPGTHMHPGTLPISTIWRSWRSQGEPVGALRSSLREQSAASRGASRRSQGEPVRASRQQGSNSEGRVKTLSRTTIPRGGANNSFSWPRTKQPS